jgi:hypothetical protein
MTVLLPRPMAVRPSIPLPVGHTESSMAVLAECYSVVVRVTTLNRAYPGGVEAYEVNCPNRTFCSDGEVCRVGFMAWADTEAFLQSLQRFNITAEAGDVAIIREDKGLLQASAWLEFHRIDGTPMGWLVNSTVQLFAAPPGWAPGRRHVLMTEAELRQRKLVADSGGVESYENPSTGEVLHVGRALVRGSRKPWWRFWR